MQDAHMEYLHIEKLRRQYATEFYTLMEKFLNQNHLVGSGEQMAFWKLKQCVTPEELTHVATLYTLFLSAQPESLDETLTQQLKAKTPPLRWLQQCYHAQNKQSADVQEEEDEEDDDLGERSFDSSGSEELIEYQSRLFGQIELLFDDHPIKNLKKMVQRFELCHRAVQQSRLSPASEQEQRRLVALNEDIAWILSQESCREESTRLLHEEIEYFKTQYHSLYVNCSQFFQQPVWLRENDGLNQLKQKLARLDLWEKKIQNEYEYYLTVLQRRALAKKIQSLHKRYPQANLAMDVTQDDPNTNDALRPPSLYGTTRPTYENVDNVRARLFTRMDSSESKCSSESEESDSSGHSYEHKEASEVDNESTETPYVDYKPHEAAPVPPPPRRPQISPALWFCLFASGTSLAVGIMLLALVGSVSGSLGIAGLTCTITGGALTLGALAFFASHSSRENHGHGRSTDLGFRR